MSGELDIVETHRMPDGTEYRVGLRPDPEPQKPEDDGQWPILVVRNLRWSDYGAEAYNEAAEPYVSKFNELFERIRSLRTWERYAKIFLGATQVHEWGFNQRTDVAYIAFDTPEWREKVGAPEDISEEKPLAEIQAWVEGEVYGVITETRYNPDEALEDDEGWDEQESTWGYYGDEWAEQAAKEELQSCVDNHKVVHRYTEHEKITPHQREIDAILEFIEAPGEAVSLCEWHDGGDTGRRAWYPMHDSKHQRVVFEYFGIDYKKIEEERELMFKRLRESAEEANDK